jgi:hypothetical protein
VEFAPFEAVKDPVKATKEQPKTLSMAEETLTMVKVILDEPDNST